MALSGAGLAISIYLWVAKIGSTELICGAYGDCVSVNSSAYAEIAGIPTAAAGTLVYAALFLLAVGSGMSTRMGDRLRRGEPQWILMVGFTLSLAGALFSLYLTGVEAFVLHAYCIWCLASWVIITSLAILWGRKLANQ